MDKDIIGLLIALVAIIGGLGLPFFVLYQQNRERRALIEKGMDPNLVHRWARSKPGAKRSGPTHGPLLWGSLLVGIGLGILLGFGVSYFTGINNPIVVNGTAVLFGGLALIVYHGYWKKHEGKKAD
ncbi:DUF6249 domain-containing protein [Catalinimonas niigatensis]|uniref:DUF6249 domain-containing protein n=1 Tax=Catalinimonas niigatensis TaxID=1397264 RepID=UPI0026665B5A|nr:DUF6249 domain-containing protein [Catalinimonas niigatensis]WPP51429.1 DUF6249 domain-containing protein [Catalinimonas niigatensis]